MTVTDPLGLCNLEEKRDTRPVEFSIEKKSMLALKGAGMA
jgi:hypothetical protein